MRLPRGVWSLLFFVLLLTGAACARNQGPRDAAARVEPGVLVAMLSRFPCEGSCPFYVVSAYEDGTVDFEGLLFTEQGHRTGQVSPSELEALRVAFERANFGAMRPAYDDGKGVDCGRSVLTGPVGATLKTVRHCHCNESAPKALTQLEGEVDRILGTAKWMHPG